MTAADFATAYALSTIAGLRPFVTLALASVAVHFGWIHIAHAYAGLGTDGATVVLLVLAVLELVADKIPGVDHALHLVHFATKPIAAALIVGSTIPSDAPSGFVLGAAGVAALNAIGVHTGITAIRGGSSALTLGMANPVVSFLEDTASAFVFVLCFVAPFAGATISLAVTFAILFVGYHALRTIARRAPARPFEQPARLG